MFTWPDLPPLEGARLVQEINRRMKSLWVLLRGVRRDGTALRVENAIQTDEGLLLTEQLVAPPTPVANTAILYLRDSGGKSQLVVRYASGAVEILNTEP